MANTSVAKETLAYCTSCKMDLAHMIVAMKGDRITKAMCKTCKKEHAFKAPKGITEPSQKPTRGRKKAADDTPKVNAVEVEWQKLMDDHRATSPKTYGLKLKYKLGEKVGHPTFGDGLVLRLIHPNKIEVIFKTDLKVLIHGGE